MPAAARQPVEDDLGLVADADWIVEVIVENLEAEDRLDAETRELLLGYARDIREKGLDYRQLFSRTKEKLARDRGFVL